MQGPGFGGQRFDSTFHGVCGMGECKKLCINALSDYSYRIECLFSRFSYLRSNREHAVWLIWIPLEIILMIMLSRPEDIDFFLIL